MNDLRFSAASLLPLLALATPAIAGARPAFDLNTSLNADLKSARSIICNDADFSTEEQAQAAAKAAGFAPTDVAPIDDRLDIVLADPPRVVAISKRGSAFLTEIFWQHPRLGNDLDGNISREDTSELTSSMWIDQPECRVRSVMTNAFDSQHRLIGSTTAFGASSGASTVVYAPQSTARIYVACSRRPRTLGAQAGATLSLAAEAALALKPKKVIVGVLDSGIDYNHPDLAFEIARTPGNVAGTNFVEKGQFPYDFSVDGHGTHVAGIISKGAPWLGLVPIVVSTPRALTESFEKAVDYAASHSVQIINISQSGQGIPNLIDVVKAHPEILFVWSAGNGSAELKPRDTLDSIQSRSKPANLLVVASCDARGTLSGFSNYGADVVDLAANGENIISTVPGGGHDEKSGTSMAAPAVVNLAAKIKEANPRLSADRIAEILVASVTHTPSLSSTVRAGGMIDEAAALKMARH